MDIFQVNLAFSSTYSKRGRLGISGRGFHWLDVLSVTEPTVLNCWRKFKAPTKQVKIIHQPHGFLIHHTIPGGMALLPL